MQVIRRRLAAGEISEDEYRARLDLLRETSQTGTRRHSRAGRIELKET